METEEALYALATNGGSSIKSILGYIPEAIAGMAGAGGGYMLTRKGVWGVAGAIAGVLTVSAVKALLVKEKPWYCGSAGMLCIHNPFWESEDLVRIDYKGVGLESGVEYVGWIKEFNSSGIIITANNPFGYVNQWKIYGGEPVAGKTITVELSDYDYTTIYDSVITTIPYP